MKINTLILVIIVILSFVVRLYKIDNPVADWHSWRQADTAAVTRNFVNLGFNPFIPKYDDLSNIQTGHKNPEGYRFVEFPVYNTISFSLISLFGTGLFTLEIWQRLVSILFTLASLVLVYKITSIFASIRAGIIAALFFGFLPYSVFYSRVILPEPTMVAFSLLAMYLFIVWTEKQDKILFLVLSTLAAGLALLIKPFAVFFFVPLLYLAYKRVKLNRQNLLILVMYLLASITPLIGWRIWMSNFPEGIPAYGWLFNQNNIRFKGAFFHWIFAERISKMILGYYSVFFLMLGIVADYKGKANWFFHIFGFSMLSYVTILASGNVQHDYYQILLLPIISMYVGRGVDFLLTNSNKLFHPIMVYAVTATVIIFTLMFSWYQVRSYYWVNNWAIVRAGEYAQNILPKTAKVIAPYGGDTAFLYQTGRQGWPQGFGIEEKVELGATHYISVTPQDPEVTYVKSKYPTLYETEEFVIISLQ